MADLEFVLFTSSFCGACALTRERIDMVAEAVGKDRVTWREVNVAADPARAEEEGIDVTPTVVLARPDGTELMRAGGIPTIEQVLRAIAANLDVHPDDHRDTVNVVDRRAGQTSPLPRHG